MSVFLMLVLLMLMLVLLFDEMIIQLSDWLLVWPWLYYPSLLLHSQHSQLLDFLLIGNDNCQPATSQPTHNTHKQQLQVDGGARTPPWPLLAQGCIYLFPRQIRNKLAVQTDTALWGHLTTSDKESLYDIKVIKSVLSEILRVWTSLRVPKCPDFSLES